MEICACLRLLARLHYIMGDYAEVGLEHPLGCQRRPWRLAWHWGMASEGAGAVFSPHAAGSGGPGLGKCALSVGPRVLLSLGAPWEEQQRPGRLPGLSSPALRFRSDVVGRAAVLVDRVLTGPPFTGTVGRVGSQSHRTWGLVKWCEAARSTSEQSLAWWGPPALLARDFKRLLHGAGAL